MRYAPWYCISSWLQEVVGVRSHQGQVHPYHTPLTFWSCMCALYSKLHVVWSRAQLAARLPLTKRISYPPQSRKASEPDREKKGMDGRADSIGSGRAIPIKQVGSGRPSGPFSNWSPAAAYRGRRGVRSGLSLTPSPFDAVSLINSESTHLTSIRARLSRVLKWDH